MRQPPFPFALVALTAFFTWIAVVETALWLRIPAGAAALLTIAAAIYQSQPVREPEEPIDEDDL